MKLAMELENESQRNKQASGHQSSIAWMMLLVLLVLSVLSMLLSCSGKDEYDFDGDESAINTYHSYLKSIKDVKTSNTNDFCARVNKWKEITDTVYHFLAKDSAIIKNHRIAVQFSDIHDSIRYELLRLTETWRYSYNDVLTIKQQTSDFHDDKELQGAVNEAQPFFLALDSIPILDGDKTFILSKYRELLKNTVKQGISNRSEMLAFIYKEDIMFRSFLAHLYEMDNEPLSDITQETEKICRNIFIAARDGKIPARDVMVYMSMRTVRRLLQNSNVCIADINNQKMRSKAQGNAYLWMIIQPFISIDQFSIATITPQEQSNFNHIISQLPKSVKFAKTFDIDQRALNYLLPQQLLKMYVLSL